MFEKDAPCSNSIRRWHARFKAIGCHCKGKSPSCPPISEEKVRAFGWVSHVAHRNQRARWVESWTLHNRPFGRSYGKDWSRRLTTWNSYKPLFTLTKWVAVNFVHKCNSLWPRIFFRNLSSVMKEHSLWTAQCANLRHRKSPLSRAAQRESPKVSVFCVVSQFEIYGPFLLRRAEHLQDMCICTCWKIGLCRSWRTTMGTSSTSKMVLHNTPIAMFVNF